MGNRVFLFFLLLALFVAPAFAMEWQDIQGIQATNNSNYIYSPLIYKENLKMEPEANFDGKTFSVGNVLLEKETDFIFDGKPKPIPEIGASFIRDGVNVVFEKRTSGLSKGTLQIGVENYKSSGFVVLKYADRASLKMSSVSVDYGLDKNIVDYNAIIGYSEKSSKEFCKIDDMNAVSCNGFFDWNSTYKSKDAIIKVPVFGEKEITIIEWGKTEKEVIGKKAHVLFTGNWKPGFGEVEAYVMVNGVAFPELITWGNAKYYYRLDEASSANAIDATGALNLTDTTGIDSQATAKAGTSRGVFSGGTYIGAEFVGNTDTGFGTTTDMSICGWIYVVSVAGMADRRGLAIVGSYAEANEWNVGCGYNMEDSIHQVNCFITTYGQSEVYAVNTSATFSAGNWYHFCITYKGSTRKAIVYVNGTAGTESNAYAGAASSVNADQINIGSNMRNYSWNNWYFDEWSIWNVYLSSNDVSALYAGEYYPPANDVPDVNAIKLDGKDSNSQGIYLKRDVNHQISFRVKDDSFAYKATIKLIGDSNYSVITDWNIVNAYANPTVDANCSAFPGLNGATCWFDLNALLLAVSDGNYAIDINANNITGIWDANQTQKGFFIDGNTPFATDDHNTTGWQTKDQNIGLKCYDSGSGCQTTKYQKNEGTLLDYNSAGLLIGDGNTRIDYYAIDRAGYTETANTIWIAQDTTTPTTTDDHNAGTQGTDANVILTATCGASGCLSTKYRLNSGAWQTFTDGNGILIQDGNIRIDYNTTSTAGLIEATHSIWVSVNKGASTTDDHNAGWQKIDQNIGLTCTAYSGNSCASTMYRKNLGTWLDYNAEGILIQDGNTRIDYNSTTDSGNVETTHSIWVAVDKNSPTGYDDHNNGWQTTDANVHIGCIDGANESGCQTISHYTINYNPSFQIMPYTTDTNTLALYHFENNANDSSGNDHNFTGMPFSSTIYKVGSYSAGRDNPAWTINGVQEPYRDMNYGKIEVWAYFTEYTTGSRYILSNQPNISTVYQKIGLYQGKITANWNYSGANGHALYSNNTIDVNRWYHIAIISENDMQYLYVDGELQDYNTTTSKIPTTSATLYYGSADGQPDLKGFIDELKITKSIDRDFNLGIQVWAALNRDNNGILIQDGNTRIDYGVIDNAGNDSNYTVWVAVDTNKPTTTDDHNAGWQKGDANITLTCTDYTSGCNTTQYRIDSGTWTTYTGNLTITTDGNYKIDYNSTDIAGNTETTKSIWVARDSNFGGNGGIDANFYSTGNTILNPEAGTTSVTINFYNTTDWNGLTTNQTTLWDENGTNFSSDYNTTRTYSSVADYNICLKAYRYYSITDTNYFNQQCWTTIIKQNPQSLDFNYSFVASTDTNISQTFQASSTTSGTTFTWLNNGTPIGEGQSLTKTFYAYGDQNICVIGTKIDLNKITCKTFGVTQIIIQVPKDEETQALITLPAYTHSIGVDTNSTGYYTNVSVDKNVFFFNLKSSVTAKLINVDANTDYQMRGYGFFTDSLLHTLQPYLLKTETSAAIRFIIQNEVRDSIPNVSVNLYKTISGTKTLFASCISDATGSCLFYLVLGDKYEIEMIYKNQTVYSSDNYVVSVSPVYFYLNTGGMQVIEINVPDISVSFNPATENLTPSTTKLIQTITGSTATHAIVYFYQNQDLNEFKDKNYLLVKSVACVGGCTIETLLASIAVVPKTRFWVEVKVYYDSNANTRSFVHGYMKDYNTSMDMRTLFVNARRSFGCSNDWTQPCAWSTIAAIIIAILLVGAIYLKLGIGSPISSAAIMLLVLGIFTYIGWFYWVLFVLIAIVLVVGVIGRGTGGSVEHYG